MTPHLIGLDFGSESARGVLLDPTGAELAHAVHRYRHGILTAALPDGTPLPPGFALQVPADYLAAAEALLATLGRGREVAGIGVDFTASSPLPALADGTPLAALHPGRPHAYVKLWKHAAAQPWAEAINARGGAFLADFGGRLSGEWLIPKAAQLAAEAPDLWAETARFIEAGDWLVWQLTGREARSLDFAAYKAQHLPGAGYPADRVPGLAARLAPPFAPGAAAGALTPDWRRRTGIAGPARVAVAMIDSHAVLPAVGATAPGAFVGALGTSAAFLLLAGAPRPLPPGLEGAAFGAALPGLWCAEAGQAAFGDTLAWFAKAFPLAADPAENFARHAAAAAAVPPGSGGLLALDWFGGNRVPHGDPALSGLLAGLTLAATPAAIYRALAEALAFGTRAILDTAAEGGLPVDRIILTSGLADANPFLVQIMTDVMARPVEIPVLANATCVGAAIHGAVAAGVVPDFAAGAARFGARTSRAFHPDPAAAAAYPAFYAEYRRLAADPELAQALHALRRLGSRR
jgi:L-ribulokinase